MTQSSKLALVLVFLLMIFAEGVLQAVLEIRGGERPLIAELFTQTPSRSNLRAFEKELEGSSFLSQTCQPVMRFLQFAALNDAGDKALPGRGGWFFYKPGARYLIEPWPPRDGVKPGAMDPVFAIVDFRDQLAALGIHLLVVPAPGKASVYPEQLTRRAEDDPAQVPAHTKKVMGALQAVGVEVVDLFTLFQQAKNSGAEMYLKQDTHWSTSGMRAAAQQTARRLLELNWIDRGSTDYQLQAVELTRYGDVLRMINLPFVNRFYQPERLECAQVIEASSGRPRSNHPGADILVLGDSFLRIYEQDEPGSAGFVSHLAYELKAPVDCIINDGGASTLVRQELARKPQLLRHKKVIVYEFVERDIRFGMEGWRRVSLKTEQASG